MTLKVTAFNFGLGFLGFLEINNLDLFEVVHHVWLIYNYKRIKHTYKLKCFVNKSLNKKIKTLTIK